MRSMATETAPPRDFTRRLWQLPTFLVGLASVYAVWHAGDRLRPSVADRYQRAIQALRPAVDRSPADVDQIQDALRKLPAEEPPPDKAGLVRYLTGSAFVALAESTTSPAEATDFWATARRDLEAVNDNDLPLADQKKLSYRLARAWYHSPGTDPARTVDALTKNLTAGDDPSEGYRMLADLYLKAIPPDETKARDSLQNFLKHASARADARVLNEARVRLAGLHDKLGEPDEARKVLSRVGPEAPAEVFASARLQLARYHQADQDWSAAARMWEQVRDMKGAAEPQRAEAQVRLAEAYVKLNRPDDARHAADGVSTGTDSPEGRAAAFQRAKLLLKDPTTPKDAVVVELEKAFAGADAIAIRKLIPAADARQVCEEAFKRSMAAGEFALALRAATAFGRVAEAGEHHRLVAAVNESWAESVAADPERKPVAREHYKAAAAACEAAAQIDATPAGKSGWMRKAAAMHLKGEDRPRALAIIGDLAARAADFPDDSAGQAWSEMADIYLQAGDRDQARIAYRNAAGKPGPMRNRARVRFASLSPDADPATLAGLVEIAEAPPADPVVHEEAVYLLGELHLLRKEWAQADARLRVALEAYPRGSRAGRGRYQYGQVLRHGAYEAASKIKTDRATLEQIKKERLDLRQPAFKVPEEIAILDRIALSQKAYEDRMRRAYDEFAQAEKLLLATRDADPNVVRRTMFWTADCAYWLGEFADAADRCEKLKTRFRDEIEELEAGRDLHRCCRFAAEVARDAKDVDGANKWSQRAIQAQSQVAEALARMPAGEFDGTAEVRKKAYWDAWLLENGAPPKRTN
jgi:Tetratricopeptide repeat